MLVDTMTHIDAIRTLERGCPHLHLKVVCKNCANEIVANYKQLLFAPNGKVEDRVPTDRQLPASDWPEGY
jgi:hypothetical protein